MLRLPDRCATRYPGKLRQAGVLGGVDLAEEKRAGCRVGFAGDEIRVGLLQSFVLELLEKAHTRRQDAAI